MYSQTHHRIQVRLSALLLLLLSGMLSLSAHAQRAINDADRVTLTGNTNPQARPEFDRGSAPASMQMKSMVLLLSVRPEAQAQLQQLLIEQQNPKSPNYHKWLTPAEFGAKFGPTDQDIADTSNWLKKFGFTVEQVGKGRMWINFSGNVQKVESAFQTNIRQYEVKGEMHHANANDPTIPRALSGLVRGLVSLNDFRKHVNSTVHQLPPDFIASNGLNFMGPADFATIYNVNPLYNATPAIDGTGQTIAIVGRTDINLGDVQFFRSFFGLPANDPVFINNGADPGDLGGGEETEADLDVEWSGAVAPKATIDFVISQSTATTDGVDLSAQFIVDNNLANVMSTSFGLCETTLGATGNAFWDALWTQAAAQGITSFVSAGDSGAAGCDASNSLTATAGLAVNGVGSTPNNISVGGTEFNEGTGSFWAAVNDPTTQGSALSYIPEVAWNESGTVPNGSDLFATGGGASSVYTKPAYQVGPGVPADGQRDIPDVALSAAGHDGYLIIQGHTATASGLAAVGGTSASSPSFAGLMALVVQKTGSAQGNANPVFYSMGQAQFAGGGIPVYHDVTSGDNSVPGAVGFSAGAGYDEVTGWGSVDATSMVNFWNSNSPDFSLSVDTASQSVNQGTTANYNVTLTSLAGYANTVSLSISGLPTGATATFTPASLSGSASSALAITTDLTTPVGSYPLTITGTDGTLTHTLSITLVVTTPDFTVSVAPASQTVIAGETVNYTATVGALNGYSGTVSFSVSGLPAGASATFAPATITSSGSTGLAVATTSGVTPSGVYPLTVTGTDGVLTHSASVTLVVTDFSISVTPSSQTIVQAGTANYTVALSVNAGFAGANITFGVTGLPSFASATFSPSSLTGAGSSALSIVTQATTPAAIYPLTITATDGITTRTAAATLVVDPIGDFSVVVAPASETVIQGSNTSYGITVNSSGGFKDVVVLSVSGLPDGAAGVISPNSITSSGLTSLAITTATTTAPGSYPLTITANSGPLVHTVSMTLVVVAPDFSLSASPASQAILVGNSASYRVTLSPFNGYNGVVNLSVAGLPTGAAGTFSPASLNTSGSSTLLVTTSASTPPGTYPLTITGTDGVLTRTTSVSLEVDAQPAADFSVSAQPTITVKRNSSGSETVLITALNGFTGTVNLSISGLTGLVSASFNPASVTGNGTSSLTFVVDHRQAQGTFPVTITGTSGILVHSTTVSLTVN